MPTASDQLVATTEAMEILGFKNASSIARLVYEHKLVPARRLPGRTGAYLFKRADIERLRRERVKSGRLAS